MIEPVASIGHNLGVRIMANRVAAVAGTNGTVTAPKAKRQRSKAGRKGKAMVAGMPRLALGLTTSWGIGIPALTLALTTVGGKLAMSGHRLLAGGLVGVCATVLAVSLSHLAWSVQDITRSARWQAWMLAIAVDLSIVLSEAVHVFAPGVADGLSTCIMVAVTAASMSMNVWAFLRHR
jgi:hypothetical protein